MQGTAPHNLQRAVDNGYPQGAALAGHHFPADAPRHPSTDSDTPAFGISRHVPAQDPPGLVYDENMNAQEVPSGMKMASR